MGYQENILPKYHAEKHDVFILTSDFSFDATGKRCKKEKKEYINEYGIPVKVLERKAKGGKYNDFENLYSTLCDISPDVIFCHGGQFVALRDVIKYCKENRGVKLFIDQHGDYYNTPVNTFKRRMGQYFIYGRWMRKAVKYTERFWGVTPWRCEYLNDVYKIPKEKIELLPMGGDDDKIPFAEKEEIRSRIRKENNISENDLLLVTGGKIDSAKKIDVLIDVVSSLSYDDLKLIVFGKPNDEMKEKIENLSKDSHIRFIGWIPSEKAYEYFLASDLAVFPGTHSVLWEQVCACGLPGLFRDWAGMHHVDVGGNALFLKEANEEELKKVISDLYTNREKLGEMAEVAKSKAVKTFSYREIASRAILEDKK